MKKDGEGRKPRDVRSEAERGTRHWPGKALESFGQGGFGHYLHSDRVTLKKIWQEVMRSNLPFEISFQVQKMQGSIQAEGQTRWGLRWAG